MKQKRNQKQWERAIKEMQEKEGEEMKLPESLKPEHIKEKILEHEEKRKNQESLIQEDTKKNGIHQRKGFRWKKAGIAFSAAAAVLILAVGGRSLALSLQGKPLTEWKLDSGEPEGAVEGIEDWIEDKEDLESGNREGNMASESDSDKEEILAERRKDVLVGIKKASDYEELFALCKEAGIIERQEEEKIGFWNQVKNIFTQKDSSFDTKTSDGMQNGAGADESVEPAESEMFDASFADSINSMIDNTLSAETEEGETDFSDTNVQVEGVDEGDILKTDGTYIYRLSNQNGEISIYRAEKEQVTKTGSISLPAYQGEKDGYRNWSDMLLYDGRLAVVATVTEYEDRISPVTRDENIRIYGGYAATDCYPGYDWRNQENRTELFVYDVSDPASPKKADTRVQEGGYQAVRMVDGIIYLVSYKCSHSSYFCDSTEEEEYFKNSYIPEVDGKMMPCDRIYLPEKPQTPNSIVITSTDIRHPEQHIDSVAILGDATQLYMSNQNIYLWQTDYGWWTPYESNDETTTTIMKYSYQDGSMAAAGSAEIKGYLNNSFSMDEYKGNLRVVTTCDRSVENERTTENQLYVLDTSMKIVGSIENLAEGEYVKSARFFGDIGYFVTFRQTDPLFSVDLSEPDHPKIIGKLKIPGFSEYLHPYGEGLLLGIGQEADETDGGTEGVKLSMFDVSNPANVREVAKCVVRDAEYSNSDAEYDHKAILVSADKNIIGFSMEAGKYEGYEWKNSYEYCLFSYDEENGFTERITHDFGEWENQYGSRGIYIEDYLYILYGYESQQIAVYRLSDGKDCGVKDFR